MPMQNYLNLLYREEVREIQQLCRDQSFAAAPWSPMVRGRFTRDWDQSRALGETGEFDRPIDARADDAGAALSIALSADAINTFEARCVPHAPVGRP